MFLLHKIEEVENDFFYGEKIFVCITMLNNLSSSCIFENYYQEVFSRSIFISE